MSGSVDLILLGIILLDLLIVSSSRLAACVQATALQGILLAALPMATSSSEHLLHACLMATGTLLIKALLIPRMLSRAIQTAMVKREVEPYVSLHMSVVIGGAMVGCAFWLAQVLRLPAENHLSSSILVPAALSTIFLGFFVLVTRRKAITQVVGYLMLENGIFVFGQLLANEVPVAVELGILLDLLVGVFVFGIAIHHIRDTYDHIDTHDLSMLKE